MRVRADRLYVGGSLPRARHTQSTVHSSQQARARDPLFPQGEGHRRERGASVDWTSRQLFVY
jgi:hypothetical protein